MNIILIIGNHLRHKKIFRNTFKQNKNILCNNGNKGEFIPDASFVRIKQIKKILLNILKIEISNVNIFKLNKNKIDTNIISIKNLKEEQNECKEF